MNCWHCSTELIWGGDHDMEDMNMEGDDGIVTNLSCPSCPATVVVYLPITDLDKKKAEELRAEEQRKRVALL